VIIPLQDAEEILKRAKEQVEKEQQML